MFSKVDWAKLRSNRIVRSAAQGFLAGVGLAAYAGEYAVISLDSIGTGLVGAASMAVLSAVSWFVIPPADSHGR